jgi:invasion protein IalB
MERGWTRTRASPGLVVALGLAAVLCLAATAASNPASAQSQPAQNQTTEDRRIEDWVLRCLPAAESQPRTCRMVQSAVASEGGQRLLRVVVGRFGPERLLGAIISVPIGVRLPPGIGLRVDDRKPWRFPFERCSPSSCQVRALLHEELLQSLKAGLVGHVTFQDAAGQPITVDFSLKGFTAALGELP